MPSTAHSLLLGHLVLSAALAGRMAASSPLTDEEVEAQPPPPFWWP